MDVEALVRTYGYAAVLCGTLLEGETVVVVAGFLSHRGYLNPALVAAAACAGSLVADQFFFLLGRRRGRDLLLRRSHWQAGAARAERLLERHGTWIMLGFRFIYGMRTITPFAIGMSRVPAGRFALLNAAGAAVWAAAFTGAGYFFGRAMEAILGDLRRHEAWILAALAVSGVVLWRLRLRRRSGSASGKS